MRLSEKTKVQIKEAIRSRLDMLAGFGYTTASEPVVLEMSHYTLMLLELGQRLEDDPPERNQS